MKKASRNKKRIKSLAALLTASVLIAGCSGAGAAGSYRVYYTYGNGSGLTFENVRPAAAGGEALLYELIEAMSSPKKTDSLVVIKPNNVEVTGVRIEGDKAVISYNNEYTAMDSITEIFYRTAVIKTICQMKEINNVDFEIDGNIIELADGIKLSDMESAQYIDDNDSAIAGTDWTVIDLYYTNENGDKLIKVKRNVAYNSDVSLESIIVSKLISGPIETGLYPVLPENTEVLGVTVTNRTCYVNFNEAFATGLVNASGDLPIYAVVNSLCEREGIESVRIMINGRSDVMFHELTSLDNDFVYDSSYVEGDIV